MKKTGILNAQLSKVVAEMGHKDMLTISDAGLPIPDSTKRIDIALTRGIPGFIETFKAIMGDLVVEKVIMAVEIKELSKEIHQEIIEILGEIPIDYYSHDQFKELTGKTKAVVRTGEITPYANIILVSGVNF